MTTIRILLALFLAATATDLLAVETITIGDPVAYSVRLPVADSCLIIPPSEVPAHVLPIERNVKPDGSFFEFSVSVYDTGVFEIPSLAILLFTAGQVTDTIWTESREIRVESVLAENDTTPRPQKPYEEHPLRVADVVREFWPWAAGALALAAVVFAWRRYRRSRQLKQEVFVPPPIPPAELAIRELIALRDRKYTERGMLKEHYSEFSEVLRRYVEGRWQFPALEMTTYELATELKRDDLPLCLRERLLPVLRESDMVKFAKEIPTLAAANSIIELGFNIVEETKPELETVNESAAA